MRGAAEATRPGGVDRLPLAREAASPETPPLVPLLAFQQLKTGLRGHQSTHPSAAANKPPVAGRHVAQLFTTPVSADVPARVPLDLLLGRPGSSRRLAAASPSWEPLPTAPEPVARHPGGGSPALFLPSPPRRWACGWSPERGARPLPPSDYSGCGGAIIAPRGLLRAGRWPALSTAVLGAWVGSASAAHQWIATLLEACAGLNPDDVRFQCTEMRSKKSLILIAQEDGLPVQAALLHWL